jgi:hypothetical protein
MKSKFDKDFIYFLCNIYVNIYNFFYNVLKWIELILKINKNE